VLLTVTEAPMLTRPSVCANAAVAVHTIAVVSKIKPFMRLLQYLLDSDTEFLASHPVFCVDRLNHRSTGSVL
jgi:hypothetical protein